MIAFGCASTDEREFRVGAARTIEAACEDSSLLMRRHRSLGVAAAYDEMLADAAAYDDLEGLVLIDQSLVIDDPASFLGKVRALLTSTADIALIGAVPGAGAREVEAIGGDLIVLSRWACAELRFDPLLADSRDALAIDLCFAARAAGRRVVAGAFEVFRRSTVGDADRPHRLAARAALQRKWELADLTSSD